MARWAHELAVRVSANSASTQPLPISVPKRAAHTLSMMFRIRGAKDIHTGTAAVQPNPQNALSSASAVGLASSGVNCTSRRFAQDRDRER
jgi:hypothetical protein